MCICVYTICIHIYVCSFSIFVAPVFCAPAHYGGQTNKWDKRSVLCEQGGGVPWHLTSWGSKFNSDRWCLEVFKCNWKWDEKMRNVQKKCQGRSLIALLWRKTLLFYSHWSNRILNDIQPMQFKWVYWLGRCFASTRYEPLSHKALLKHLRQDSLWHLVVI